MSTFNPRNYFLHPKNARQRQYDALRDYYLNDLTQKQAAKKHGYSPSTFQTLVRDFKQQKITFFDKSKKGPKKKKIADEIIEKIVALRKNNHSITEIRNILKQEGHLSQMCPKITLQS